MSPKGGISDISKITRNTIEEDGSTMDESPHKILDRGRATPMKMKMKSLPSTTSEAMLIMSTTEGDTGEMIMIDTSSMIMIGTMTTTWEIDILIEDPPGRRKIFQIAAKVVRPRAITKAMIIEEVDLRQNFIIACLIPSIV